MAYGARLESVLGASPQGFESLILRQSKKPALSGFFLWLDFVRYSNLVRWAHIARLCRSDGDYSPRRIAVLWAAILRPASIRNRRLALSPRCGFHRFSLRQQTLAVHRIGGLTGYFGKSRDAFHQARLLWPS